MSAGNAPAVGRKPYLHDLVIAVQAPVLALSTIDGQIRDGAAGCYASDRRMLSGLVLTVDGVEPVPLEGHLDGAARARFVAAALDLGDAGADPTVIVERDRSVTGTAVREVITVVSHASEPVSCTVRIALACDLAPIYDVASGRPAAGLAPDVQPTATRWRGADGATVRAEYSPPADRTTPDGTLSWTVALRRQQVWELAIEATIVDDPVRAVVLPVGDNRAFSIPTVRPGDNRLTELLAQSVSDLRGLLVADAAESHDQMLAAGAPWFLTLFGRDSIWAARMTLPLGTRLAGGTLRALARRQGIRIDAAAEEQPGKILHELRRTAVDLAPSGHSRRAIVLPPVYYGSVDATSLWITLLHDAWRWGLPTEEVETLMPALHAALGWLRDYALGSDGFIRYADTTGHGLVNQGWKDSQDAVQFSDGTLAAPPIALCEVQAYAHAAAGHAAALLEAFDRPGAEFWRGWAAELRSRFRNAFWVDDVSGRYPAMALDGHSRPADTVTSNLGHLLGTGLLDPEETAAVVRRLAGSDLDSGFGLRTMSAREAGYNPLSYHCGSVWPHDTAIAIAGLAASPGPEAASAARSLIGGLLAAAPAFAGRLPELYGGQAATLGRPVPYPSACRPQAWSAAASLVIVAAILGLAADVPSGVLRIRPMRPSPVGELTIHGLRVGGGPLDVQLTASGEVEVIAAPAGLTIQLD